MSGDGAPRPALTLSEPIRRQHRTYRVPTLRSGLAVNLAFGPFAKRLRCSACMRLARRDSGESRFGSFTKLDQTLTARVADSTPNYFLVMFGRVHEQGSGFTRPTPWSSGSNQRSAALLLLPAIHGGAHLLAARLGWSGRRDACGPHSSSTVSGASGPPNRLPNHLRSIRSRESQSLIGSSAAMPIDRNPTS
jgi:hypothetical protein